MAIIETMAKRDMAFSRDNISTTQRYMQLIGNWLTDRI
jgi:hypothetical protein